MTYKLTKIKAGKAIRTKIVVGEGRPPKIGYCFVLSADPIVEDAIGRIVSTSEIQSIEEIKDETFIIETYSGSKYMIEKFPDVNQPVQKIVD